MPKNETWLKANLHNPFRDWVDYNARKCKAYSKALRAIAARELGDLPYPLEGSW